MSLGRAYVNIGKDFIDTQCLRSEDLLDEFAKLIEKNKKGKVLVYEDKKTKKKKAYEGRTKKYICEESNRILKEFTKTYFIAQDPMTLKTSKKQITRLIKSLKNGYGRISCYSIVIFHTMYKLLLEVKNYNEIKELNTTYTEVQKTLKKCMEEYLITFSNDYLALFLIDCCAPFSKELEDNIIKNADAFPAINRHNPTIN